MQQSEQLLEPSSKILFSCKNLLSIKDNFILKKLNPAMNC